MKKQTPHGKAVHFPGRAAVEEGIVAGGGSAAITHKTGCRSLQMN